MYMHDEYDIIDCDTDNQDDYMLRTVNDFNLYELMGQDFSVWLQRNKKFGFDLEISNDEGLDVISEKGIHPFAIESLATFCRRFLHTYSNVIEKE